MENDKIDLEREQGQNEGDEEHHNHGHIFESPPSKPTQKIDVFNNIRLIKMGGQHMEEPSELEKHLAAERQILNNIRKKAGTVDDTMRSPNVLEAIKLHNERNSISFDNNFNTRLCLTMDDVFFSTKPSSTTEDSLIDNRKSLIDTNLYNMKDRMMEKIDFYKQLLEKKYDEHIERVKRITNDKARRITKVLCDSTRAYNEGDSPTRSEHNKIGSPKREMEYMKKYTAGILNKLEFNFDIHDKIVDSIDKNFEIMSNFLNRCNFFHDNPLQDFVNENAESILNSWIFAKINFEKLNMVNLIENSNIPENLKNFIFQDTENKFSMISIKKSPSHDFDIKLLLDNYLILEKLMLKDLCNEEVTKIFSTIFHKDKTFDKLKELIINKSVFRDIVYFQLFPNLEKLCIERCQSKMNLKNISDYFKNIRSLILNNCNLFNDNINSLMEDLSGLPYLEILDLSNNFISVIELSLMGKSFQKLNVLILKNNKLYKFHTLNMKFFPNLRFLDLRCNQFTSSRDLTHSENNQGASLLVLANKTPYLLVKDKANTLYINYLTKCLTNLDFTLKKLDLSYIFNSKTAERLPELVLSPAIKISIKKLNLSNNSISACYMLNFFKVNSGFLNLRILKISNNNINDELFELLFSNTLEINESETFEGVFESLEYLDIADNAITVNSCKTLELILKSFKLTKINLSRNPIEQLLQNYIQQEVDRLRPSSNINPDDDDKIFQKFLYFLLELRKDKKLIFSQKLVSHLRSEYLSTHPILNKIIFFEK